MLRGGKMNTVTLEVRTLADTLADFKQGWESDKPSEARISFEAPPLCQDRSPVS